MIDHATLAARVLQMLSADVAVAQAIGIIAGLDDTGVPGATAELARFSTNMHTSRVSVATRLVRLADPQTPTGSGALTVAVRQRWPMHQPGHHPR